MISGRVLRCSLVLLLAASGAGAEALDPCVGPPPGETEAAQAPPSSASAAADLGRIVTEQELLEAVRFLTALPKRPPGEPPGDASARLGVVLGDVVAVLADLQASEVEKEVDTAAMTPAGREWYYAAVDALHRCAERRFDLRGGPSAYLKTRELVEKMRSLLEEVVLPPLRMPRPGTPWPRRGGDQP
jgi:hypothetical protein